MTGSTNSALAVSLFAAIAWTLGLTDSVAAQQSAKVLHKTMKVGDLDIFYREAGPKDAPTVLLLHGFPTSSQMFRNLIPALADQYHLVSPDYPGYGHSSMPSRDQFSYTFDSLAKVIDEFTEKLGLTKYALYVQDYGAPVGYRLAVKHPERITAIVVQNGNAYEEGLDNDFWKPLKAYWKEPNSKEKRDALRGFLKYEATRWQYTHGVKDPELVSPDGAAHDQFLLDRKGNDEIRLGPVPGRGHRVDPWPDSLGRGSTIREGAPQDHEGRRPGHLLSRGRADGRPDGAPAPRLPDQFADVPQPDPRAG
ncbi:MAG TPA: alpha/beta fold hydrolase, partial [Gemmataceae bacterium]|nr:alpha/beta fold hydrolase [Gemmataceae bacterium]